jgi:TorA maturation chaperone TorD
MSRASTIPTEAIPMSFTTEREVEELLCRAGLFRALALAFADPAMIERHTVTDALERLETTAAAAPWCGLWRETVRAWRSVEHDQLVAEYNRLFHRQVLSPPYETAYGDGRRIGGRPVELADIRGFYEAFGITMAAVSPDRPDHLAAELEFYTIVLLKTAYAAAEGWQEQREVSEQAAKAFLHAHLGHWVGAFRDSLDEHSAGSPYAETVRLIDAVLNEECGRLNVVITPSAGRTPGERSTEADTFTCPMASSCGPREPTD